MPHYDTLHCANHLCPTFAANLVAALAEAAAAGEDSFEEYITSAAVLANKPTTYEAKIATDRINDFIADYDVEREEYECRYAKATRMQPGEWIDDPECPVCKSSDYLEA